MTELDPDSEQTLRLLDDVRAGDEAAFGRLFDRFRPDLFAMDLQGGQQRGGPVPLVFVALWGGRR